MIRDKHFSGDATRVVTYDTGKRIEHTRVFAVIGGKAKLIWELISSTFLDRTGNPFYSKDGTPFQGKQE